MELAGFPHPECTVHHEPGFVRAYIGVAHSQTIRECYEHIVTLALENRLTRVLVVGDRASDPLGHLAAHDAVVALAEIGVPAGFRLAFVPRAHEPLNAYRHAEIAAQRLGLRVQVFLDEGAAAGWLTAREEH